MKKIKNILVCMDSLKEDNIVLEVALTFAEKYNADIFLFHAVEIPNTSKRSCRFVALNHDFITKKKNTVENMLIDIKKSLSNINTNFIVKVTCEKLHLEILNIVKSNDIDMIVIGACNKNKLKHILFKPMSYKVVKKAPCLVLSVKCNDY